MPPEGRVRPFGVEGRKTDVLRATDRNRQAPACGTAVDRIGSLMISTFGEQGFAGSLLSLLLKSRPACSDRNPKVRAPQAVRERQCRPEQKPDAGERPPGVR